MADLREKPPGRAPWVPAPDPWWLWLIRFLLVAAAAVLAFGTAYGVVDAIAGLLLS